MSHYAKVFEGKVTNVIVAEEDVILLMPDNMPGNWIKTSYNTIENQNPNGNPIRGNFAGIGYIYDAINDVFYAPKPYSSWILNQSKWIWESPIPMPTDNNYIWDEETISWIAEGNVSASKDKI